MPILLGEEDDNDDVDDPEFGGGENNEGGEGSGGDNDELAEQNHSTKASDLSINQYLIAKALAFAECEIAYACELYQYHKSIIQYDVYLGGNTGPRKNYKQYIARYQCGMATSNSDVIRAVNREMNFKLAAVGMYNSGKTRDIIESAMGMVVDESAPQLALAYREEERLEDITYYSYIKTMNSLLDKSSLYVGTSAMASVAENQLLLAAKAARAAEMNIASATSIATRVVDYLFKDKDLVKPRPTRPTDNATIGINGQQEPWFGPNAPVRPDNPNGFTPDIVRTGVVGGNVNIGAGASSIPSDVPLFTGGR